MLVRMESKYSGKCRECGERLYAGDDIIYDTDERNVMCPYCGDQDYKYEQRNRRRR